METTDFNAGIPETGKNRSRTTGAAALCKGFMESTGWLALFDLAKGTPYKAIIHTKNRLTGKLTAQETKVTPDADQRLAALRIITSYGYGKPAELAAPDDSGRTVTDLLLAALRPQGNNEARP